MANAAFDTLTASKDLHKAGIEMAQAEAIALVVKKSQGDLATKADVDLAKAALGADINLAKAALGADIDLVRAELEKLRTEFDARIKNVESGLTWLKWVVGVQMAITVGGFGILFSRLPMP